MRRGWVRQRRLTPCELCGSAWVDVRFEGDVVAAVRCPHCKD